MPLTEKGWPRAGKRWGAVHQLWDGPEMRQISAYTGLKLYEAGPGMARSVESDQGFMYWTSDDLPVLKEMIAFLEWVPPDEKRTTRKEKSDG